MHEKISALLDGELEQHECERLLDRIGADPGLSTRWQRYHMIGATMRSEPLCHSPELPERVRAAIHREPAPQPVSDAPRRDSAAPVGRWRSLGAVISGTLPRLAVAASFAGALAVGVFMFTTSQPAPAPIASSQTEKVLLADVSKWDTGAPELQDTLNGFLVEHGEFTSASGMNGLMAYAKFVSYDVAD